MREITRATGQIKQTPKISQWVAALAPDGANVVARVAVPRPGSDATIAQIRLYLTDARGQDGPMTPIPLGPQRAKPTQLVGAAINEDWVVWMETPSTSATVQPWVMYAYNRSDGDTSEVTKSQPLADGTPALVAPGYTGPSLHGNTVVWAEVGAGGRAPRVDVVGCLITNCSRRALLRGAAYPAVTRRAVYAVTAPGYRGEPGKAGKRDFHDASIARFDFATGKVRTARRLSLSGVDTTITGLAANGNTLAWTSSPSAGVPHVTISRRNSDVQISGTKGGQFGYPVATNSVVAWAESSGTSPANVGGYAYRFSDRKVYSVGNTSGLYAISAAGRYLSWQQSEGTPRTPATSVIGKLQ